MMTAQEFLSTLFGHPSLSGSQLAIWDRQTKRTKFYALPDTEGAAADALARAATCDVYFGVCPYSRVPDDDRSRGSEDLAAALVGLWADIDVQGPAHKASNLPPNREAAFDLLYEADRKPSLVVSSGYGLQAWWLLDEPFLIRTDADRQRARAMSEGWINHLARKAKVHGWAVDPVGDLARVLRVPGTFNHKQGESKAVEVMTA